MRDPSANIVVPAQVYGMGHDVFVGHQGLAFSPDGQSVLLSFAKVM